MIFVLGRKIKDIWICIIHWFRKLVCKNYFRESYGKYKGRCKKRPYREDICNYYNCPKKAKGDSE